MVTLIKPSASSPLSLGVFPRVQRCAQQGELKTHTRALASACINYYIHINRQYKITII